LPSWLTFDAATNTFSGIPANGDVGTISIEVSATDEDNLSAIDVFDITVNNANDAPTDITLSNQSVTENESVGTVVGSLISTDVDTGDSHTYSLVTGTGDADNSSFTISGDQLLTAEAFDLETKSSYSVRLQTDDGNGGTFEKEFTITVNDANDAPTDIILSNQNVSENVGIGIVVGTLGSFDQDTGDSHTYSLVAGTGDTDNSSFSISGNQVLTTAIFDFETKSSYSVRIRTDDGNGGIFEKAVMITITDVNESPTDIALSSQSVSENQDVETVVGTLSTTDVDTGDSHTYSLVAGSGSTDNVRFSISGSPLLTTEVFDFETRSSYSVRVKTDDGSGGTFEKEFTITINDVNETPTDIALSSQVVAENQVAGTVVGSLSSADEDSGDSHTYSLVAGTGDADNTTFTIIGNELQTAQSFNFESRATYSIRIQTDDQNGGTFSEAFTITVSDVNDAPSSITLSGNTIVSFSEINTTIGTLSTQDDDDTEHTYTITAGNDNSAFIIDGATLQNAVVFTNLSDSNITITITATDGGGASLSVAFDILIEAFIDEEAPVISNVSDPQTFEAGSEPITLSANVTDFAIDKVLFNFRKLTEDLFTTQVLSSATTDYTMEISETMLGAAGIEFFFSAVDMSANASESGKFKLTLSFPSEGENALEIPVERFGGEISDYQVIAIPYVFEGTNNRVDVIFDEYGGNPDNRTWRLIRYDNALLSFPAVIV